MQNWLEGPLTPARAKGALGGDIDNHRAWRHAGGHFRGDEDRRFLAGHGGGGDDRVLLGQDGAQQFALPAVKIFAHGLGVAALVFGAGVAHVQHDEARAEAFNLLLDGGADIVAAHHGAEPARGGDGLQPGHARTDHQHARGGERSGGGHEHGKHARERIGRDQDGFVAGDGRHG